STRDCNKIMMMCNSNSQSKYYCDNNITLQTIFKERLSDELKLDVTLYDYTLTEWLCKWGPMNRLAVFVHNDAYYYNIEILNGTITYDFPRSGFAHRSINLEYQDISQVSVAKEHIFKPCILTMNG